MIMESSAYNFRHLVAGKTLDRLAFISNLSSPLPVSFSVRHEKAQPCGDRTLAVCLLVMLVIKWVQWALGVCLDAIPIPLSLVVASLYTKVM